MGIGEEDALPQAFSGEGEDAGSVTGLPHPGLLGCHHSLGEPAPLTDVVRSSEGSGFRRQTKAHPRAHI